VVISILMKFRICMPSVLMLSASFAWGINAQEDASLETSEFVLAPNSLIIPGTSEAGAHSGLVKSTLQGTVVSSAPPPAAMVPADLAPQSKPDHWSELPEAASATLGMIGTVILLLRRRQQPVGNSP
jgi:hypothetical protein